MGPGNEELFKAWSKRSSNSLTSSLVWESFLSKKGLNESKPTSFIEQFIEQDG